MFALYFVKPGIIPVKHGDVYTDMFEMRQSGDYDDFIVFEESKV